MLFLLVSDLKFKVVHRIHRKGAFANGCGEITIRHTNAYGAVLATIKVRERQPFPQIEALLGNPI
jgi:hypothetical protein